jgi:5-methylcytosine-specific restriction endonuclease McrA
MANKPNQGRAGIFRPWDGKLTGPAPGEPSPMPDRNQSWSSVQKKQAPRTFTVEEVKELIAEAVSAVKSGKDVPDIEKAIEEKKELPEEQFVVGGK